MVSHDLRAFLTAIQLSAGSLLRLKSAEHPVAALVDEVASTFQPIAPEKNISLTTTIAEDLSGVRFDHERIVQVFSNLLSNAMKFTAEGGHISIGVLPADALMLAHFLHTQLRFMHVDDSRVVPFAPPTDILDACALHPATNSPALRQICERERDRLRSGTDVGFAYSGPGAVELVERLNELYGIP